MQRYNEWLEDEEREKDDGLRDAQGKTDSARAKAEAMAGRSECGARSSPIDVDERTTADSPKKRVKKRDSP